MIITNDKLYKLLILVVITTLSSLKILLVSAHKHSESPLLLLVSFDGFRWDYLNSHNLTNFQRLRSNSSYADFIYNSFATLTFPNHWTMVTGLYEESHGIIQNDMYDPTLKKVFSSRLRETHTVEWFGQNKAIEPIWTTNQKAGENRRSAAEWVGSNLMFANQSIIHIPFNHSTPYNEYIDQFVGLFVDPNGPINFGALYFDEPDNTGHVHGPYSEEMKNKLIDLDHILGYLIEKLQSNHLYDKLNLIVTSDHGMEATSFNNSIFLDEYVNVTLFEAHGSTTIKNLFLKNQSDLELVYKSLKEAKNVSVYKKDEFPDDVHFKNNVRFGDLLLLADLGYMMFLKQEADNYYSNGSHGYFNNESSMYPIFIAHGPAFKRNYKISSFSNVDMYELMCAVLEVNPAPNNGSLENVRPMFAISKRQLIISMTPIISAIVTAIALYVINKRSRLPGQTMLNDGYMMLSTSEIALLKMDEVDDTPSLDDATTLNS